MKTSINPAEDNACDMEHTRQGAMKTTINPAEDNAGDMEHTRRGAIVNVRLDPTSKRVCVTPFLSSLL